MESRQVVIVVVLLILILAIPFVLTSGRRRPGARTDESPVVLREGDRFKTEEKKGFVTPNTRDLDKYKVRNEWEAEMVEALKKERVRQVFVSDWEAQADAHQRALNGPGGRLLKQAEALLANGDREGAIKCLVDATKAEAQNDYLMTIVYQRLANLLGAAGKSKQHFKAVVRYCDVALKIERDGKKKIELAELKSKAQSEFDKIP